MNYLREFYRRFAQIFPTSGTVIISKLLNVIFIKNFVIFTLELIIFIRELCFTYSKKEHHISSLKRSSIFVCFNTRKLH